MSVSIVIGAGNQTVAHELRALAAEVDDVAVADVADTSARLETAVVQRQPDVVLVHADLGPTPVLHLVRDLVVRRPATAFVVLVDDVTSDVLTAAMDAGARGVVAYPVALEDLQARVTAAAQWSAQMRRHLAAGAAEPEGHEGRGTMVVVAGAKGGVGTSTLATHLGYYLVRGVAGKSVCLVDLDLEKGDLGHLLGATHRLDLGDLATVADDLGPQTVSSAVHRDASGLGLLLAPESIDGVGAVGERETRLILDALRRQFDLVVVDAGAHVTPVSAAAVEVADEVLLVTTPDVLALRGVHRALDAWERVGVRAKEQVRVVVNQASRRSDIQVDAVARLVPVPPMSIHFPAGFRRLEPGINYRDPAEVKDQDWWGRVGALARDLGLLPPRTPDARPGRWRRSSRLQHAVLSENGQASLEFTALFPLVALFVVLLWQLALWGATAALAGHAADEGARASSLGQDAQAAALDSVPSWFRQGFDVTDSGSRVHVSAEVPILAPGLTSDQWQFSTDVGVVHEP